MDCKQHSKMFAEENGHHQQQQQQLAKAALKTQQQHFGNSVEQTRFQTQPQLLHPLLLQDRSCLPSNQLPIDDFHLLENPNKYGEEEKQLRIKLTAVYRLIELNGWAMGIYNHVTAKLDKHHERILIHPFGLHYNEITASSLLKIDMSGNIVDQGSTNFELNRPGYIIHSAIHLARPDLKAIIHLHYPPVAAASTCKYGLLPICQEQALLGEISYLDYNGILTQEDERDAVAAGLGQHCKVMILRNHGLIVCGESIEEAFYLLTNLMRACETQARILALGGIENLVMMNEDAASQAYNMVQNARYPIKQLVLEGETASDESTTSGNESDPEQQSEPSGRRPKTQMQVRKQAQAGNLRKHVIGHVNMFELDFEAQMRALDLSGHQTGYKYRRPLVRHYKSLAQSQAHSNNNNNNGAMRSQEDAKLGQQTKSRFRQLDS